jgi:hypothetical protein
MFGVVVFAVDVYSKVQVWASGVASRANSTNALSAFDVLFFSDKYARHVAVYGGQSAIYCGAMLYDYAITA